MRDPPAEGSALGALLCALLRKLSVLLPPPPGSPCGASLWRLLKAPGEGQPPPPPAPQWLGRGRQREGWWREAFEGRVVLGRERSRIWTVGSGIPGQTRCLRQRGDSQPKSQCGERRPNPLLASCSPTRWKLCRHKALSRHGLLRMIAFNCMSTQRTFLHFLSSSFTLQWHRNLTLPLQSLPWKFCVIL